MIDNQKFTTEQILNIATVSLKTMVGHTFDVLTIAPPISEDYAIFLSKINSKLSPIVGNMIEEKMTGHLNENEIFKNIGTWVRQDPGFPDNIFQSDLVSPVAGIEVKAWFPFSTEITGRFKTSESLLSDGNTLVALVAWVPEFILHGRPKIIDVWLGSGYELAKIRDNHYFKPPHYLVIEPEDTTNRTVNLQQQNVEGYVLQDRHIEAQTVFEAYQIPELSYPPTKELLEAVIYLRNNFNYRLETNFAKINRIQHPGIASFKQKVFNAKLYGKEINFWKRISNKEEVLKEYLKLFPIK